MHKQAINPQFQRCRISQIGHTDRPTPNLVFISRANAAPCRADFGHGVLVLPRAVQFAVHRKDQRSIFRDHQVFRRDLNAPVTQRGNLADQMPRVQNHAIADHT